jgi:hypothetical protein
MYTILASPPCEQPPAWAVLQRQLFDAMREAAQVYLAKYTRDDGSLIWAEAWPSTRDGVDDFYEAFVNWPLLYLLGGDDWFLHTAQREWDAITRQLTAMGPVLDEYERGYDQFHQSEHYTYFYFLCLADPNHERNLARAERFAGLYLNPPNYDPQLKLIRAPHNGSGGPRWGFFDSQDRTWAYSPWMQPYGLPFDDVPGVTTLDDLKDANLARRMGEVIHERYGKGDVATNLGVTSLVANAWLLTGEPRYRDWLAEYVGAWMARAQANGGLIPDNVGLSGQVGEYLDGKWYGGLYGWQWPHGFYNLAMATLVAATAAFLTTGETHYFDLPRWQMDGIWALRTLRPIGEVMRSSLGHHWVGQLVASGDPDAVHYVGRLDMLGRTGEARLDAPMCVVPYRHGDHGWFDFQPMSPIYPAALWNLTRDDGDWARISAIRSAEQYDWRKVIPFRGKEDAGHEQPWLCFLQGENPDYPERILRVALDQVSQRLRAIEEDRADLRTVNVHHWQVRNPVTTEALVQLTLGAPQPIYNGGLLIAPVRYFDAVRGRPGLPPDVASLVEASEATRLVVRLVNVGRTETREAILQAGAFGEHRWDVVTCDASPADALAQRQAIGATHVKVILPPMSEIRLVLEMTRHVNPPSYRTVE